MKKLAAVFITSLLLLIVALFVQTGCNSGLSEQKTTAAEPKELSNAELLARGRYIVTTAACNDCHSPKIMTAMGPVPDSTKLLSGHPAGSPLPPMDKNALKPGYWALFSPDLTASAGPWGISFSANLTPDTATGIGAWTEEVFVKTLRTGRHLGQPGGRHLLPPMPQEYVGQYNDEDLKSIFTYLKALPPIRNKVPEPVSPDEAAKMK